MFKNNLLSFVFKTKYFSKLTGITVLILLNAKVWIFGWMLLFHAKNYRTDFDESNEAHRLQISSTSIRDAGGRVAMLVNYCTDVSKCCFCVPIRHGVVILGYFNLVVSLLILPLLVVLLVVVVASPPKGEPEPVHPNPLVYLPLSIGLLLFDVVMTIILLVGAHKRNQVLLKLFFYGGGFHLLLSVTVDMFYFDYRQIIENLIYGFFFCLQVYLIYLVYNIIHRIDQERQVKYVNQP